MPSTSMPTPDFYAKARFLADPTTLSISGTTAKTSALAEGLYILQASVAWFFLQGAAASVVATTSSNPLQAWEKIYVWVSGATEDASIAGITSGASGTAYLTKVS